MALLRWIACLLGLAILPLVFAQNPPASEIFVFEKSNNEWFEGPLTHVSVSPDGNWALFFGGLGNTQLYSLATRRADPVTLRGGLDRLEAAGFCGPGGFLRLGARGTEFGIFLPGSAAPELASLPPDAIPVCSPGGKEIAYYRASAPDKVLYAGPRGGDYHDYGIDGKITAMTFSADDEQLYYLLFHADGHSSLGRITLRTGSSKTLASGLDASPLPGHIAISADGRRAFVALASAGLPDNEARHRPDANRWLKIYEINLATGARRVVAESPGQDNSGPQIAGGSLYWSRTIIHDSIVLVPVGGGEAKEVAAGGEVPMWSPDGKRIGYTFGGWRLADWALDLDDAVVSVDAEGKRTSEPSVIVSGYHEDFPPAWSPNGRWIAFHSHRSAKPVPEYSSLGSSDDIYLRRADDVHAPEIRLTDFGWETGPAYWSPDGKKLLFSSWDHAGQRGIDKLWILTIDTEMGQTLHVERLPLPDEIHSAQAGAWSPDGKEIAIEDNREGQKRILWVVPAVGSGDSPRKEKLLDYEGTTYGGLDWTPDGKTIVYSGLSYDGMQLFAIPREGGTPRQLTHDSGTMLHPRVSPDGKWIACTRIVQSKQIWRRPLP